MSWMANAQESVTLSISNVSDTDEFPTLTITSDVSLADYSAYQFDLLLPEGVRMPYDDTAKDYGYYETIRGKKVFITSYYSGIAPGHNIEVSEVTGGYRFLCYSSSNDKFEETDENGLITVLTLELEMDESVAINGTYPIVLSGTCKFSKLENEQAVPLIPTFIPGKCTITGGTEKATIPFTMSAAGWGTLILPFAADLPMGLQAYTCSSYEEKDGVNWLTLTAASSLAANTPYIIAGTAGNYEFEGTPNYIQTSYTDGLLTGVLVATSIDHGYVLQKQDDEVAFFKVESDKSKMVPAYRCYLNDDPSGAVAFRLSNGSTSIESLKASKSDDIVFDLQGRRVAGELERGIYVCDGKLIMVK